MIKVIVLLALISFLKSASAESCVKYSEINKTGTEFKACNKTATLNLRIPNGGLPRSLSITILVRNASRINLNLTSINKSLANENTPVIIGGKVSPPNSLNFPGTFTKSPIQSLAVYLGGFELYQDKNKLASMMIYKNRKGKFVMEGEVDGNLLRYNQQNGQYDFITTTGASIKNYTKPGYTLNDSKLWKLPVSYGKYKGKVQVFKLVVGIEQFMFQSNIRWERLKNMLLYFNAVRLAFSQFQSQRIRLQIAAVVLLENATNVYDGKTHKEQFDQTFINQFLSQYQGLEYHVFVGMINNQHNMSNFFGRSKVYYPLKCNRTSRRFSKAAVTFFHSSYKFGSIELARKLSYLLPNPKIDPSGMFMECFSNKPINKPPVRTERTVVNNKINNEINNEIHKGNMSTEMNVTIITLPTIAATVFISLVLYYYGPKFINRRLEESSVQFRPNGDMSN